jgi:c(7)-type cytochrome triheme protein
MRVARALLVMIAAGSALVPIAASAAAAKDIYAATCAACHASGVAGAPKLGDAAEWQKRLAAGGQAALVQSVLKGKGAMPPRGGNAALTDDEIRAVVQLMTGGAAKAADAGKAAAQTKPAPAVPAPASAPSPAQAATAARAPAAAAAASPGRATFDLACAPCHRTGVLNSPRIDDPAAWTARLAQGVAALQASAIGGKGGMPPKGANPNLSDDEVRAAVDYIVASVQPRAPMPAQTAAKAAPPPVKREARPAAPATSTATASASPPSPAVPPPAAPAAAVAQPAATSAVTGAAATPATSTAASIAEVNAFNRLLKPLGDRNRPPASDGIHDPANDGTHRLQPPLEVFSLLPRTAAGNGVDWVKALADKRIAPRADRLDPAAQMAVMDLNIVREVKGSMPDVVYPHKQHTEWLDCSNCHPAIFIPQKGANQISMASILLGQKCGVCHGKVAFPVSECRACHSRKKTTSVAQGEAKP